MSVPWTEIWCDACNFKSTSLRILGDFVYEFGASESDAVYVNSVAGWCGRCANIEAMEDLTGDWRQVQGLDRKVADQQRDSRSFLSRVFGLGRSRVDMPLADTRDDAENLRRFAVVLQERVSPPRCLRCGSPDVAPLLLPSPRESEVYQLEIRHPECGGNLLMRSLRDRFALNLLRRVYDTEGNFLREKW